MGNAESTGGEEIPTPDANAVEALLEQCVGAPGSVDSVTGLGAGAASLATSSISVRSDHSRVSRASSAGST